jgi:hypothetical protein
LYFRQLDMIANLFLIRWIMRLMKRKYRKIENKFNYHFLWILFVYIKRNISWLVATYFRQCSFSKNNNNYLYRHEIRNSNCFIKQRSELLIIIMYSNQNISIKYIVYVFI